MNPPLKWHGGKHYLAARIVALMPPHLHYVEPFAGGLSVLLAKNPEGVSEVVNDLDNRLTRFWEVLRGERTFAQFARLCEATPFSQVEWANSELEFSEWPNHDPEMHHDVVRAWQWFVLCRQSMAGRMDSFAPLSRTRVRRGMNEQASAWLSAVEGLPQVHARLRRVVVLNQEAVAVIAQQDGIDTLFYCDPPYLHETRASTDQYAHEMTADQHGELLEVLGGVEGKFLLSGYRSELYDDWAAACKWGRHDFDLPNNSASGKSKRRMTECLWCNF